MDLGGGASRLAARTRPTSDYRSAQPEQRVATAAVRVAVAALTIQFVIALVAAALIGWALTIDPTGPDVSIDRMRVSVAVSQLVTTTIRLSTGVGIACLVTLLIGAACVIRWQTRALRNLSALGVPGPQRPVWLAGLAWFVPGWGLLSSQRTLDELWHSGQPLPTAGRATERAEDTEIPGFLSLWWALWVLGNVTAAVFVVGFARSDLTASSQLTQQLIAGAGALILMGAGSLMTRVLTQITARQDARNAQLALTAAR